MTEEDQAPSADAKQPTSRYGRRADDAPPARAGALSGRLALILASIALIASGYLWYHLLIERRDLLDSDILDRSARLEREMLQLKQETSAATAEIKPLRETQETLKAGMEKLHAELGRNRNEWVLAETEQLLLIANHRLQLARDVGTALSALRSADQHLRNLADPRFLPVRKEIVREVTALESLGNPDISGIALRLANLSEAVNQLPLAVDTLFRKTEMQAKNETGDMDGGSTTLTRRIWNDLRSLVRIQSNVQVQRPLLPPEQRYFLRQNLQLMLNGAQLALLQNDVATYHRNIDTAMQWLEDYFDQDSQMVVHARNELERLRNEKIVTELPDISASLVSLRKIAGAKAGP